jgi:hypothetical protein
VRRFIATSYMRPEKLGGVKLRRKPNGERNHITDQGKAKILKVNESESSVKRRYTRLLKRGCYGSMGRKGAVVTAPYRAGDFSLPCTTSPFPRRKEGTYQNRMLNRLNRITPMESAIGRDSGSQTVRGGQFSSGCRKSQEANAGSRKATDNWPDRAMPKAKACRRGTGGLSIERCEASQV